MARRVLGIITARGGSKRIPRKNVRLIAGKPLIAHTIHEALRSRYIDKLVVSTDDHEISHVAGEYGAEVPFTRPDELATDNARSVDVLIHAVKWLEENEGYRPDIVVLLEPTSPLRTAEDIDSGIGKHLETGADSVVGVVRCGNQHPLKAKVIEDDRLRDYVFDEKEILRSQDLPPVYFRNGAYYSVNRDTLMNGKTLYGEDTKPHIMDEERSLDINTELDLKIAGLLLEQRCEVHDR